MPALALELDHHRGPVTFRKERLIGHLNIRMQVKYKNGQAAIPELRSIGVEPDCAAIRIVPSGMNWGTAVAAGNLRWIGIDWGTTNLRAYLVGQSGELVQEAESGCGMNSLKSGEFEAALVDLVEPWLEADVTMPVLACGMVGARQGWKEAKYRPVPCSPFKDLELTGVETRDQRIAVYILPGFSQAEPADVMRGEETQVAGFLASEPDFNGVVCLPGTHTKWVEVKKGVICAFHTFMSGELFSLLAGHSILRHSMSGDGGYPDVFLRAARRASGSPNDVFLELFGLRAASLLSEQVPENARARLSGMLVGHEIGVARRFWDAKPVMIIGTSKLASLYRAALDAQGVETGNVDARSATLSGLAMAAKQIGAIAA